MLPPLPMPNFAFNYLKLPKTAKICPKTIRINKASMYRGGCRTCAYSLDFQYKNFSYAFFIVKNGLCMWISAYPFVQNGIFLKVPCVLWVWDFDDMYLIHFAISLSTRKRNLYSNFERYGIANECVRFGGHEDIQVSYHILYLEVPKKAPILHNLPWFEVGFFWGSFGLNVALGGQGLIQFFILVIKSHNFDHVHEL
jgi:hypothetical protein